MTRWLDIAWAELGQHEVSGNAANPHIVQYFRDSGRPEITSDEVAWCAAFVGACLERAAIPPPMPISDRLRARAYLHCFTDLGKSPRNGAIAVFSRGSDPAQGHVGFVVGVSDGFVHVLGGNQTDSVSIIHMPVSRLLGCCWPGPPAKAADVAKAGSRIIAAATRQLRDVSVAAATVASVAVTPAAPAVNHAQPSLADLPAQISNFQSGLQALDAFRIYTMAHWPTVAIAVAAYCGGRVLYDAFRIRFFRTNDHNTGANVQTLAENDP